MNKIQLLSASHMIAARIFGYLWVNDLLKIPKGSAEELLTVEKAFMAEFSGMTREILKDGNEVMQLDEFGSKFGLDSILAGLEMEIQLRGSEWEYFKEASELIKSYND